MTEEQTIQIMQAISEAKSSVTKEITTLATAVAGFNGDIAARVKTLETDAASQKKWSRINSALLPAYAMAHGIASHLGFKI